MNNGSGTGGGEGEHQSGYMEAGVMMVRLGLFGLYGDFPALVAATRQAEALGIDAVLFGEHHGAPQHRFPALLNLLSALAAPTTTIRLGTSVVLSALEN